MQTEREIADQIKGLLSRGACPDQQRETLYQRAIMWAHEEGAVDVSRYASDVTSRVWALMEVVA